MSKQRAASEAAVKDLLAELKRLRNAVEKGGDYGFSQGIWAECIDRIEILEAPAREVIKQFEGDGADTMAVLNAYIQRCSRQQAELAKLNAKLAACAPDLCQICGGQTPCNCNNPDGPL